jgi:DNA-binding MarR family transcriptional regulator
VFRSPDYAIDFATARAHPGRTMSASGNSMHDPERQARPTNAARREKTAVALGRLAEVHKMLLWDRAKQHGLTPIQLQVFLFVAYHPPSKTKVSLLAGEFFVSKASISDTVKALLGKELLQKISEPEDGRSYSLRLTTRGRKLCRQLDSVGQEFLPAIAGLEEKQQDALYRSLLSILNSLVDTNVITNQRICFTCRHYEEGAASRRCTLLNKDLTVAALRVDCPEHQSARPL